MASYAIANDDVSHAEIANKFVAALQHQRFKNAAAMFAPEVTRDIVATELVLKRIDDSLGGFSTIHPVANLPNGRTIKLEAPAHKNTLLKFQKFVQIRYVSTASDGKPVFYEVNLTADSKPPQILSFGLHFPASDEQLSKRANQLISLINR
jgi:hypothetical protein